ncbi:MAG: sugar phosphate isomerase/epimerase [Verrucomicrobia bacterium]|nr:sugar phosphate isomerase/epimerase [Verrucomicrobiota bacterium]MBU4427997.1 sugar phosphate isomerase/epimerase [Verrucomicrobiota bacterium]MBU4496692.1 sugar phosphate isomerase/epimerase [Verrucomicrobiota bacterium]MCG2679122.1 sugar phosphate isomerase/epimerase [Kiritimatiellia bacterium]
MTTPIALQLYSIRQELANDFEANIRRIAEMGYAGVEPAGFPPSTSPEKAAKLFKELGLVVPSAHTSLPVGEMKEKTLDLMNILGSKRIVSGFGPKDFETMDGIKKSCDRFNEAGAVAVAHGMAFGIHNHWWEYLKIDGQYVYRVMLKHLAPEVFFELDTYWVRTAGADPAAVIRELGVRIPLLHIKDGSCRKDEPMTAVGEGIMDFHPIAEAAGNTAEWMIVELDACATDMMEAVSKSYKYLTREKIARGKH